jgi:CubicO group peptidase (beta-lactamase class C family)
MASGLVPAVQLEGEPPTAWGLEERMEHYAVPGVSVAVLDGGRVVWARGYGTADGETGTPVSPGTLFQAASISKPVAAITALALVEAGEAELDAPVNEGLTSWTLPENEFTADSAVTLRHLLTHSAGTTVWGFPGYRKDRPWREGQPVPTNVQVLDGEGNTDSVRVYKVPGTSWQYSGGGYTVAEQMVEDVTGRPFADVARERVLEPAGMTRSTYAAPLPEARFDEVARGHQGDGAEVEGEWHTYPEQAAAGLWTTPSELLTLSAHLLGILDGSVADGVLRRETVEAMLAPHRGGAEGYNDWGLGFGLSGEDEPRTFSHGGSNAGFKSTWSTYRDRGQGIAVMTNGDRGSALAGEMVRAVGAVLGWEDRAPVLRSRITMDSIARDGISGEYEVPAADGLVVTLEATRDEVTIRIPGQGVETWYAASPDTLFSLDGAVLALTRDAEGRVTGGSLGGTEIRKR